MWHRFPIRSLGRGVFYIPRGYLHSSHARHQGVPIEAIKELRKRTGAPIGEVKKALIEQSGDLEAAIDHLRKRGASLAAKKGHREASEGLVGIIVSSDKDKAAIVEVNSETDFVARTPQFGQLLRQLLTSALKKSHSVDTGCSTPLDVRELLTSDENGHLISNAVSVLGENIVLRRASCMHIERDSGAIYGYTHRSVGEGCGTIGSLVALQASRMHEVDRHALDDVGHRLAMHIAAAAPLYVSRQSIPREDVDKEKAVITGALLEEQNARGQEKPQAILDKIVEGRLNKWMSNSVLEEQTMLVETDTFSSAHQRSVSKHLDEELRSKATIRGMICYRVGEEC